jgi:hypothetical protein
MKPVGVGRAEAVEPAVDGRTHAAPRPRAGDEGRHHSGSERREVAGLPKLAPRRARDALEQQCRRRQPDDEGRELAHRRRTEQPAPPQQPAEAHQRDQGQEAVEDRGHGRDWRTVGGASIMARCPSAARGDPSM